MNCEQAAQALSAELDGELSLSEKEKLSRHLESCEECRRLRQELFAAEHALRELPQEPCGDIRSCVMRRVRREPREKKVRKNGALSALAIAAALVIVVFPAIGVWEKNAPQNAASISGAVRRDTGYAQSLADSYGCGILVVWGSPQLEKDGSAELDDSSVLYPVDEETAARLQDEYETETVCPAEPSPIRYALVIEA